MERNLLQRASVSIGDWLRYQFLNRKMETPFGLFLLGTIAVCLAYITALDGYKLSIGIVAGVGVLLICIVCVLYPMFGFLFSFVISLFIVLPERLLNGGTIPTGLIPEFFSYLTLIGVITNHKYRKEAQHGFWNAGITIALLVFLSYYFIELVNPAMGNKLGWFNAFRKQFSYFVFFYLAYCLLNSRKAIRFFTNFWIIVSSFEALYACKQQWFGFFDFEYTWLIADEKRYNLFVNWGFARKFGLLSDPASAGILFSATAMFILVLALRERRTGVRMLYYLLTIINLLASTYTGTRTATVMIVGGVLFYCIVTLYERRTLFFTAFFAAALTFILVAPIYNNVVFTRVRSAFEGSKDPSALVRDLNRKAVQPYVYMHPIGGGIFTCGNIGELYNPGHYLNNFPPDSGYMAVMMEMGFIGLIMLLVSYYIILRTGIRYFYRVKDPYIKTLYVANLVYIFTLFVAMYSQQAIGQYPSVFYYLSALALLLKLHQFDLNRDVSNELT